MTETLQQLIEASRSTRMTPQEREEQRRSFAYGNTHFENRHITREIVAEEAERLAEEARASGRE